MTDFLKVYFVKNQFYLVISIWGVTVIFLRDVTIGIRAKVLKIFLNISGLVGSEIIDVVVCCVFVLNVTKA